MTQKELKKNTSADALYETSGLLTDSKGEFWKKLTEKCSNYDQLQLAALYHIGAAVVRAIDGLTKSVQGTERSIDKVGTELGRVAENRK